jgi:hypothetical protein
MSAMSPNKMAETPLKVNNHQFFAAKKPNRRSISRRSPSIRVPFCGKYEKNGPRPFCTT